MNTNKLTEEIKFYLVSRLSKLDFDSLQKLEEILRLEKSTRPEETNY